LLKRIPPGAWATLTWSSVAVFPFVLYTTLADVGRDPMGLHPWWVPVVMVMLIGLLRRRPLVAFTLILFGAFAASVLVQARMISFVQFIPVYIALCYIAGSRPRRVSAAAAAMAFGALIGYSAVWTLRNEVPFGVMSESVVALTVVIAWMIGNSIRQRRDYADALRAQAAAQAVTAERLRIARELHDMVAHSIGIIAIQAGMGSRVIETQPLEARKALKA
jgi:signal transduction histidine kinase